MGAHRRGFLQRERASPDIASPFPCLARIAAHIASLPASRDMGHSAQKHYFKGISVPQKMALTKARLLKHDFPVHGFMYLFVFLLTLCENDVLHGCFETFLSPTTHSCLRSHSCVLLGLGQRRPQWNANGSIAILRSEARLSPSVCNKASAIFLALGLTAVQDGSGTGDPHLRNLVGHFRLPLPLAFFTAVFFPQRVFFLGIAA